MSVIVAFAQTEVGRQFYAAYDRVLGMWPEGAEARDVSTAFGDTRVNVCGLIENRPLVLLPGAGATSTVWFQNVEALSQRYRVYAIDLMGDVGRSVPGDQAVDSVDALLGWLSGVLDELGLTKVSLVGHSYGAMVALAYSLRNGDRIDKLTLLDPNSCFGGMSPRYLLRALPILLSPNEKRQRSFIDWETGGAVLDPEWLDVLALGAAHFPTAKIVVPKRPKPAAFEHFQVDTTVVLAGRGRVHDAGRISSSVRNLLPDAETIVLEDATHHTLPMQPADQVNEILLG